MDNQKLDKIKDISIDRHQTVTSALRQMDEKNVKLLIVTEKNRFSGLLSIGDIQRAILKSIPLESEIKGILRKDVNVCHVGDNIEHIKRQMIYYRAECMPVLDSENNLVDIYFWNEVFGDHLERNNERIKLPVIIMAGGKGTRLKPITNIIPKPLVPLGEKPIIELIIERFVKLGVSDFYISINYKGEMIERYFQEFAGKPYRIHFIKEKKSCGTAGSLSLLKEDIKQPFFVTNCDILIDEDYRKIYHYHRQNKNELTLVAAIKHLMIPYGTMQIGENGSLKSLKEKPELNYMINAGMYILEAHLLDQIPSNQFFQITELIEKILNRKGKVGVFPISEKSWLDIGQWSEYNETLRHFEKRFV